MGLKHLILVFVTLSIFGMVLCKSGDPATVLAGGDDAALSNQSSTALPITSPSSNMTDDNTTSTEAPSTAAPQTNPSTAAPTGNTGGTTQSDNITMTTPEAKALTNTTDDFPTEAPLVLTTEPASPLTTEGQPEADTCERGFDAASFVGGMVFVAGLGAIGFFVYTYCKSRNDPSYRTL